MTAWPNTLPQRLSAKDFSEMLPDNALRTQMDVGPPKVRRRTISTVGRLAGSMVMTDAQWGILKTFFQTTLTEVLTFDFPDPSNIAANISVKFNAPPKRAYNSPGTWRVTLSFDIQP